MSQPWQAPNTVDRRSSKGRDEYSLDVGGTGPIRVENTGGYLYPAVDWIDDDDSNMLSELEWLSTISSTDGTGKHGETISIISGYQNP